MNDESRTLEKTSKTQLKREAMALQDLGRELISFPTKDLDQLQLNQQLRTAIDEFKRLPNSHGAKKRQLQYIGRLIREHGGKVLQMHIRNLNSSSRASKKPNGANEIFEKIISNGESAITEIVSKQDKFERQKLRQLKSNILKSQAEKRTSAEDKLRAYINLIINK